MTTDYYRCHSIMCDGDDALIRYSDSFDKLAIEKRYCRRCGDAPCVVKVPEDYPGFKDAYKYQYYDRCHNCGKFSLVSSGTGSCHRCDHPNEHRERDERGRFVSIDRGVFTQDSVDNLFREYNSSISTGMGVDMDSSSSGGYHIISGRDTDSTWTRREYLRGNGYEPPRPRRCSNCNEPIGGMALGGLCSTCGTSPVERERRHILREQELARENDRRFWALHDRDMDEERRVAREHGERVRREQETIARDRRRRERGEGYTIEWS